MVYNLGMHTWSHKANTKKNKRLVTKAVVRNSSVGTHAIHQAEAGEEVDIKEAWRRAMWLSCTNIKSEKVNLVCERNWDKTLSIGI